MIAMTSCTGMSPHRAAGGPLGIIGPDPTGHRGGVRTLGEILDAYIPAGVPFDARDVAIALRGRATIERAARARSRPGSGPGRSR